MIPVKEAIKIIDREIQALGGETVRLDDAVGRVLAEDVVADSDMPPFDRSQMDGYAVKAEDTENAPVMLKVVGESAAGRSWIGELLPGQAVRIMTGARLPMSADTVQKVELTSSQDGGQWTEGTSGDITILEPTKPGRFIVPRGSEVSAGETVLKAGTRINEGAVAPLASFGYTEVKVVSRPRVAIMATGTEIVDASEQPGDDQIRNSNSPMLRAFAQKDGADVTVLPISGDDLASLKEHISGAIAENDFLVLTGGVSVGKYDLTKLALSELGAQLYFERVRLKPGKPTVFGRLGKCHVFGLPGNPVSSAVTYFLFVRRAILAAQGATETGLLAGSAVLDGDVKGTKERESYLPARLRTDSHGRLIAEPIRWHGSSDFIGFAAAEALIRVPESERFEKGDVAGILFLPR